MPRRASVGITFSFSVSFLDWFCPSLMSRRRRAESMRRAGLSMEDAPLIFQQGLPSVSPLPEKTVCQAHCRNSPGSILAWKYNALAHEKGDVRLQRWPPAGRWCRCWGCEPVEGDDDIHRGSRFHLTQPFLPPPPPLRWWRWRALVSAASREGGRERENVF